MKKKEYKYDVALSFAGEDRQFAEQIAEKLKNNNIKVFYDKYEEVDLWGKDLYTHLDEVYQNKAKYCIIFISKNYAQKVWTNFERKSAQARAFQENEYILPVRLDNTQIPGLLPTVGYIDAENMATSDLADLIINKLNKSEIKINNPEFNYDDDIFIPKVRRKISDLEKNNYLSNSFLVIQKYFDQALKKLQSTNSHVVAKLNIISNIKFGSEIYIDGDLKIQCKIWIGGMWGSGNSISYSESTRGLDYNNDNSLNDSATVEDDGKDIYFKLLGMSFGNIGDLKINFAKATEKEVAKYFWGRFTQYLNY